MEATCACLACGGGSERLVDFYDRGWIVGHYDDEASFEGSEYSQNGAWQLGKMREFAESSDGYLCSLRLAKKISIPDDATTQGEKITSEQRKIGVIEPNTTPLYGFASPDGGYETFPIGEEDKAEQAFEDSGADHLYKIVPLGDDTQLVGGDDYRLNEYETPNTFSSWEACSPQIRALYLDEDLPKMNPTSYTGDQTELLCEEYIRLVHPEFFPLMQTGGATGTNEGIDILGEASGTTIIGEVKNRESIEVDIVETLRGYGTGESEAYYFVRGGGSVEGVTVVTLETVLEKLSDSYYDQMLEQMTS